MKPRRLFGLRSKFIVLIVVILVIIFGTVSYVLVRSSVNTLRSNLVFQTKSFAELATGPIGDSFVNFKDSGRIRIRQVIQGFTDLDPNITDVQIVDIMGNSLFSQNNKEASGISVEEAEAFSPIYLFDDNGDVSRAIVPYFESSGVHRYSIVYDVSDEIITSNTARQITTTALFSGIGLLASIAIMFTLMNYLFIDPIKMLSRQAKVISDGNLNASIGISRHDEVGDLALAVENMTTTLRGNIKELEDADKLKTEFLIITSHNLRTPITIIKGYLEEALRIEDDPEMRDMLQEINLASKRLSNFAEDILAIAHVEAGRSIGNREKVKVADFINKTIDDFGRLANEKEIQFSTKIDLQDEQFKVNSSLISGALWNLLDNALMFTEKDGQIDLDVKVENDEVIINVKDTGVGISDEEQAKLFTKFHRGTSALTYDYEGLGVGLFAAKLVVEEHGGSISAKSKLGEGSTFTIKLPLS